MDNVGNFKNKILFLIGIFIMALAFSAAMPGAEAGTVLAPPQPEEKLAPGEFYPESRFGRPPARVETGVSRGYASRAVEEMEGSDEDVRGGSRAPAGLMFKGDERIQTLPGRASASASEVMPASSRPTATVALKGVQEVALIASDLGYFPKTVFVSRDVPVRMFVTGSSKNTLCIMMDSFQVRKQVRSQKIEEITFTPNVPGKYRFYCPVNGMEGTLIVKELASAIPEATPSQQQDSAPASQAAPSRRAPASDTYPATEPRQPQAPHQQEGPRSDPGA